MIGEKTLSEQLNINLKLERLKGTFTRDLHYYKYSERKIVYDKNALFAFIKERSNGKYIHKKSEDMGELISKWKESA